MYISPMRRSKFIGVYSLVQQTERHGKKHYFAWGLSGDAYAVQELNAAFRPVAEAELVESRTFIQNFQNEPSILAVPVVTPDFGNLESVATRQRGKGTLQQDATQGVFDFYQQKTVRDQARQTARAEATPPFGVQPTKPRSEPETPPKQGAFDLEAARKAKVLETHMRETFRQILLRLKRPRERQAAMLALKQLASATEGIVPEHKHMFRDFGVRLRQSLQPELALLFNRKTVELAPNDDHARFNLARILCILGQYDEAATQVRAAMNMDQNEPIYGKMLAHILALQQEDASPSSTGRS